MILKNLAGLHAILPRRRVIATSLVYGLSLAVRYTSATGDEVEIPPRSMQGADPAFAIMTKDGTQLPYRDRRPYAVDPIVFRRDFRLPGLSRTSCPSP